MGKRCSLGLFCFAVFIAFDPAFAQIEAVTEKDRPRSRKSSASRPARPFPWKTNIVTTLFWIGEKPGGNNLVPNRTSAWDKQWTKTYGGFDDPNPASRRNYVPVKFTPRRTRFTAHFPIMTKHVPAIGQKRLELFRGFKRRIRVRLFPLARIDGSRSAKAIESLMRSGKTQDHSERTIGNTCLAINVQNPI